MSLLFLEVVQPRAFGGEIEASSEKEGHIASRDLRWIQMLGYMSDVCTLTLLYTGNPSSVVTDRPYLVTIWEPLGMQVSQRSSFGIRQTWI